MSGLRFRWFGQGDRVVVLWWCPGCSAVHQIPVGAPSGWTFEGTRDAPTFSPSILTRSGPRCHSYVEGGRIRFLDDCAHALKGQTVEAPALPADQLD